jgi:hypothetical protein
MTLVDDPSRRSIGFDGVDGWVRSGDRRVAPVRFDVELAFRQLVGAEAAGV